MKYTLLLVSSLVLCAAQPAQASELELTQASVDAALIAQIDEASDRYAIKVVSNDDRIGDEKKDDDDKDDDDKDDEKEDK